MKHAIALRWNPGRWASSSIACSSARSLSRGRAQTDIGSASISMAPPASSSRRRIFPSIARSACCSVGAGEMIELAASHFLPSRRSRSRWPTARSSAAASSPTARRAIDHAERDPAAPHEFDIVVTCTASTLPIIGRGLLTRGQAAPARAVFIVDLAVPRDVEPQAADLTTSSCTRGRAFGHRPENPRSAARRPVQAERT